MYKGVKTWNDIPVAIKFLPKKRFYLQYKNFQISCY